MIGLESVRFQGNSEFGDALVEEIKILRKLPRVRTADFNRTDITKIIQQFTGLLVTLHIGEGTFAAMEVPDIDRNNPILPTVDYRKRMNVAAGQLAGIKGHIDGAINMDTGMVTGDYTRLVTPIILGEHLLWAQSRWSVAEVVAILLHEIGHIFVYLEMLTRTTTTNYVMLETVERLTKAQTAVQRVKILQSIDDHYDGDMQDIAGKSDQPQTADYYKVIIMSTAMRASRSELGTNIYDSRAFEQLADQYVTRMGYGAPLAVGLDKLFRLHGGLIYSQPAAVLTWNVLKVITTAMAGVLGWWVLSLVVVFGYQGPTSVYDPPRTRVRKVQQELNGALKDRKISPATRRDILSSLDIIEKVLEPMGDNLGVWDWVNQNILHRGTHYENELQLAIQSMSNNSLFRAAAKIEDLK